MQKVTVLVNFEKPHSAVSVEAFRQELKDLLDPAGVTVELMLRSELGNYPEFSELVVSLLARDLLDGGISIPLAAREALRRSLSSK